MAYSRLLRLKDVMARTGLTRSTIYVLMAKNEFPKQIQLTLRCVGWDEDEIQNWILKRIEVGHRFRELERGKARR